MKSTMDPCPPQLLTRVSGPGYSTIIVVECGQYPPHSIAKNYPEGLLHCLPVHISQIDNRDPNTKEGLKIPFIKPNHDTFFQSTRSNLPP